MIKQKNNTKTHFNPRFDVAFPSCMKRREEEKNMMGPFSVLNPDNQTKENKPRHRLVPISSQPARNVDLVSSLHGKGKEKGREKGMINQRGGQPELKEKEEKKTRPPQRKKK
ncbi:hypothetical protein VTJ04DRAFT_1636 [Mycothermus thermophilus]|uniref:uncharacterized protein n=1 Tax=Humicola insolens TaxID=85995 RepID=UPI0037432973